MIRNPWRKDGSIRYFELFKIAVIIIFLMMVFSIYLESSLPISKLSAPMGLLLTALWILQLIIINYELKREITRILSLKVDELIHFDILPLKGLKVFTLIFKQIKIMFGLAPELTYRVMRI